MFEFTPPTGVVAETVGKASEVDVGQEVVTLELEHALEVNPGSLRVADLEPDAARQPVGAGGEGTHGCAQ